MENVSPNQEQEPDHDEIIIKCDLEEMAKAFFKDYEIIWHDPNVNSQENQQNLTQLKKLCKVKTFTYWKEAEEYIKTAKTICHVITSGTNGELLVKEIFSSQNVPKIFTFCRAKDYHYAWAQGYEKILCTETKIEDVISQIQKNLQEWQKQTSSLKFDLPAFAPVFNDWDKSQMNHLHLYLKVIPNFNNRTQAKKDFVDLSKTLFLGHRRSEKSIADFDQNDNQDNMETILKWYSKPTFLHKVVNNCLRIATSDSIQYCRLLLKDLEMAIKDQYQATKKNFSGLLYRAAYLSEKEWSSMKENVNREIEMHGFLSVSKNEEIAWKFMSENPAQKVFITILVPKGSNEEEQGYAEIEELSEVPKEQEILFNVRSRFTVLETEDEYSKDSPYRHLVLLYGAQGLRKFIAEKNPEQQVSIENTGNIVCSRCQVRTDEMPEKLLFMSLVDLEKRIYSCKKCLEEKAAPFLCIPVTGKVHVANIKGCLLMNSSQTLIPFYGYKCSECGVKNQKRYFVCTDCSHNKMKWCENCFENSLSCFKMRHPILLESSPFTFWCEKMSENELTHLNFQKNLMTKSNDEFQQAEMYSETHEYEKAIEYYNVYIGQNEAKGKKDKLAHPYSNLALVYTKRGEYKPALEYLLKSLTLRISIHIENCSHIAASFNDIGLIYHKQGEYKKALQYHLESLEMRRLLHGENHSDVATSHNNIGLVYHKQEEYKKAVKHYLKSLKIRKAVHGQSHPDVAISYNNIGSIYQKQGEYKSAHEYYLKSLDLNISIYGESHSNVAISYSNLGLVSDKLGDSKTALEYHLKSLNIRKIVSGESHPDVPNSYNNIGLVYQKQGEYKRALEHYFKSLALNISIYGENHHDVATSYNNIGSIYHEQREFEEALEYHLKSLNIRKAVYRENHSSIAVSYNNIGLVHEKRREYMKALEYYFKSLNIRKSIHGENPHSSIAVSYNNIGFIYKKKGKYKEAFEYYFKSLALKISIYGESHHDVAISFYNIGSLYLDQGKCKEALEYHLKSLKIRKSVYGKNHSSIAVSYNKIGLVHEKRREYKKALECHYRSLNIRKSIHSENHPLLATSYENVGRIYENFDEYEKALQYYLKSLEIHKSVYGEGDLRTEIIQDRIDEVMSVVQNTAFLL